MMSFPRCLNIRRFGALLAAAGLAGAWSGCVQLGNPGMYFTSSTLNKRPVRLVMDTGADSAWLYQAAVKPFGVRSTVVEAPEKDGSSGLALSEPVRLSVGETIFTSRFALYNQTTIERVLGRLGRQGGVGAMGWLAVRDNILSFDGTQRTVVGLKELPKDLDGWMKLKVRRSDRLVVEIPQEVGPARAFLIDTGAQAGVDLAPEAWQAWKASAPDAPTLHHYRTYLGRSKLERTQTAWAEKITLGPLTLMDVLLHPASPYLMETMAQHRDFGGLIGIYALARMDLIVDGKNGVAYARPKTSPGVIFPGLVPSGTKKRERASAANLEWNIAESVALDIPVVVSAGVYAEGAHYYEHGDFEAAIAAFNQVIEFAPHDRRARLHRGLARQGKGDIDGAILDFDRVLEFSPDHGSALFLRGLSKAMRGDYDGATTDLSRAIQLDDRDAQSYAFRGMIKTQRGDSAEALVDLDRSLELDPKNAQTYAFRGMAKLGLSELAEALLDFDRALELDPKNAGFFRLRGDARKNHGDEAGALADRQRAETLEAKRPTANKGPSMKGKIPGALPGT